MGDHLLVLLLQVIRSMCILVYQSVRRKGFLQQRIAPLDTVRRHPRHRKTSYRPLHMRQQAHMPIPRFNKECMSCLDALRFSNQDLMVNT